MMRWNSLQIATTDPFSELYDNSIRCSHLNTCESTPMDDEWLAKRASLVSIRYKLLTVTVMRLTRSNMTNRGTNARLSFLWSELWQVLFRCHVSRATGRWVERKGNLFSMRCKVATVTVMWQNAWQREQQRRFFPKHSKFRVPFFCQIFYGEIFYEAEGKPMAMNKSIVFYIFLYSLFSQLSKHLQFMVNLTSSKRRAKNVRLYAHFQSNIQKQKLLENSVN